MWPRPRAPALSSTHPHASVSPSDNARALLCIRSSAWVVDGSQQNSITPKEVHILVLRTWERASRGKGTQLRVRWQRGG